MIEDRAARLAVRDTGTHDLRIATSTTASGVGRGQSQNEATAKSIGDFGTIGGLLSVLARNKWLISTLVVITTSVVALAALQADERYRATALVRIDDTATLVDVGDSVPAASDKYYPTQVLLLRSPSLLRRVVLDLDLEHNQNVLPDRATTLGDALSRLLRLGRTPRPPAPPVDGRAPDLRQSIDDETARRIEPYRKMIESGLTIQEVPGTQLISINFEHNDPEVAVKVANAVAQRFAIDNLERRVDSKTSPSALLQKRVAELQAQVCAGQERLLNYTKAHEILSTDVEGVNPGLARLTTLGGALLEAESEAQTLEATHDTMVTAGVSDTLRWPVAEGGVDAQQAYRELGDLKQRRVELLEKYPDDHPSVRQIDGQIADAEKELDGVRARLTQQTDARYGAVAGRAKLLRAALEQQRTEMLRRNEASIGYEILRQDVETSRSLAETVRTRLEQIDIWAASAANDVELTVPAVGAERNRSWKWQWVCTAFFGTLCVSMLLLSVRERLDQTIRSLEEVGRVSQLPQLGVIPALETGAQRSWLSRRGSLDRVGRSTAPFADKPRMRSFAGEAYRHVRTSVLLSADHYDCRVLLVTSSQPREGKTTTAVNVAISLAQTGARTLILDCDMRHPAVHSLLAVDGTIGLSSVLSHEQTNLQYVVQPHEMPNLFVLPCGALPPNPAELLGSDTMREVIDRLAVHFDHIVIDSPPVVAFADGVILATMVDGVILVVRSGHTGRSEVVRSRELLHDVGARICGVVLNDVPAKADRAYYDT